MGALVEELILHDLLEEEELEELKLSRLVDLSSEHDIGLLVYCFCALKPGESIRQYLSSVTSSKRSQLGPCRRESLVHLSPRALKDLNLSSLEEGQEKLSKWWGGVAMLRQEWQTHLRSAQRGDFQPFVFRAVLFGDKEGDATQAWNLINWPAVIIDEHGVRHWGMLRQGIRASGDFLQCWALRDLLAIKHTTAGITVVSVESGCVMWQNAASMAMMGCHGSLNSEAGVNSRHKRQNKIQKGEQGLQGYHYLDLLFYAHKEDLPDLNATVQRGGTFRKRVEITHPVLRYLMGLGDSPHFEEAHHDVEVTVSRDPVTLERAYTISQTDVSDTVLAQKEVLFANKRLAEEKERTEYLMQRQHELIACLSLVTDVGRSSSKPSAASQLLDSVRRQVSEQLEVTDMQGQTISMSEIPIGEGMYGKVYKGTWQGQEVAVKRMMLPTNMSGAEKNQRMAVMEAAISSSLHHPNIVKTHTYSLKPVFDKLASAPATSQTLGQPLKASCLESTSHASSDISAGKCNASNTLIEPLPMPASPAFGDKGDKGDNYPDATNVVARLQRQVPKLVGKCDQSSDEVSSIEAGASSKDDFAPRGDRKWNKPNASATPSGGFSFQNLSGTDCTLLPRVLGFEVQIVLEYCDCGSLRDVLDAGRAFVTASYDINYSAMLDIALDIAKGMEHLHSTGLIHSDLKARNVLLRRNPSVDCGVVAKISDFGLSFQMESSETHVSDLYQGTTTHLAPEVILEGRQSRMSDVYAYGITLWELYTALRPFSMIPAALVGHQVTQEGVRPEFPQDAPEGYVMLVQQCWNQQATERPSFLSVIEALSTLRLQQGGKTMPLSLDAGRVQALEQVHRRAHLAMDMARNAKPYRTTLTAASTNAGSCDGRAGFPQYIGQEDDQEHAEPSAAFNIKKMDSVSSEVSPLCSKNPLEAPSHYSEMSMSNMTMMDGIFLIGDEGGSSMNTLRL